MIRKIVAIERESSELKLGVDGECTSPEPRYVGRELATLPCVSCEGVHVTGIPPMPSIAIILEANCLPFLPVDIPRPPIRLSIGGAVFCERSCASDKVEFRVFMELQAETRLAKCDGNGMFHVGWKDMSDKGSEIGGTGSR